MQGTQDILRFLYCDYVSSFEKKYSSTVNQKGNSSPFGFSLSGDNYGTKGASVKVRAHCSRTTSKRPAVTAFFHQRTNSLSYVVADPEQKECVVIDPVLDFDQASGTLTPDFATTIVQYIKENNLKTKWILETHIHADRLTSSQYIKGKVGGAIAIGAGVENIQKHFRNLFNLKQFSADGSQFDHLIKNDDFLLFGGEIGTMEVRALSTPGHTPSCMTYCIGDAIFVGDTLFMPDFGTARCDFPGGDAKSLYKSVTEKIFTFPATTRMFMCHDYAPGGRKVAWETTIEEQKKSNKHLNETTREEEFLLVRRDRDKQLSVPNLFFPSIQFNMNGGRLFDEEDNGKHYFKLPINDYILSS